MVDFLEIATKKVIFDTWKMVKKIFRCDFLKQGLKMPTEIIFVWWKPNFEKTMILYITIPRNAAYLLSMYKLLSLNATLRPDMKYFWQRLSYPVDDSVRFQHTFFFPQWVQYNKSYNSRIDKTVSYLKQTCIDSMDWQYNRSNQSRMSIVQSLENFL